MRRLRWALIALAIFLGEVGTCFGGDLTPPFDEPRPEAQRPGSAWPTAIILEPPANRDALLEKLSRPDLLIWEGDGFERWVMGRSGAPGGLMRGLGVVGSVLVSVAISPVEARGRLRVELRVILDTEDRLKVPIGLDGLILGKVSEAGRDLPVSFVGDNRAWSVELFGKGEHVVEVESAVPVRATASGKTLDLAIPPAAATRVELVAARPLIAARSGFDEPLIIDLASNGSKAEAHLRPRSRLELTWQEQDLPSENVSPILAARGEMTLNVGPSFIETRETWSISALRGSARQVVVRLAETEEVVNLLVDRRPALAERRHVDRADFDDLVIPLTEPIGTVGLAPGSRTATISLATKRSSEKSSDPTRFTFRGHSILDARSQTGVVGVARSDLISISAEEGRAIRRVDPKTELPEVFRGRPEAWLGFEFSEQPFDLKLEVEPAVARFEVNSRSTVVLKGGQAEVVTTMLGRVWQGRLFDLKVEASPGLAFEPTDATGEGLIIRIAPRWSPPDNSGQNSPGKSETLVATFPRSIGPGENFAITLRGTTRITDEGVAAIGLFRPLDATIASTELALVTAKDRRVDQVDGSPRFVRLDTASAPPRWNWPQGFDPAAGSAPTWLRADRAEGLVSIRVASCPKLVRHKSSLTVAVDRQGADVVDEILGDVANGSTSELEVALPPEVNDRWVAESGEGLEREPLVDDPATGWRRYRLKLPQATDAFQIRLRYRVDFVGNDPQGSAAPLRFRVQPIRVLEGRSIGQSIRLTSEADVALAAEAPGWTSLLGGPKGSPDSSYQVRRAFEHVGDNPPSPIAVSATLGTLAEIPNLVASRLWLRSKQLPGGQLATTAQYRLEVHGRSVMIRLPEGSSWVRGAVGTSEINSSAVERIDPNTYRITLPSSLGSGPMPLRVDSVIDQSPNQDQWPAPELVGGIVQQSAWELSLLGTRAGVGVPDGWTDENVWYRDGVTWKRRPRRVEADLARWLAADGSTRSETPASRAGVPRTPEDASTEGNDWSGDFASGRHSYLFSRPGPPTPLYFATYARPTLLLVCSGPVLLVGLLVLARRPPSRWVASGLLAIGFTFVAAVEPNTAVLVAESSSVGFALAGIAALIHGTLERQGRSTIDPEVSVVAASSPPSGASSPSMAKNTSNALTVIHSSPGLGGGSTSDFPVRSLDDLRAHPSADRPESDSP